MEKEVSVRVEENRTALIAEAIEKRTQEGCMSCKQS